MSGEALTIANNGQVVSVGHVIEEFTPEKVALIKREIAQGCTDDELAMFLHHAKKAGLDPLARQIYMIRRRQWDQKSGGYIERASIQVGIDGFRAIADRTGTYAPGEEKFEYNKDGYLTAAHVSLKKLVAGTWHEVWASAYWEEYAQVSKDGKPTHMWAKMPRVMLAKVAEAKALRKAYPAQLSGLYTADEMAQADNHKHDHKEPVKQDIGNLPGESDPTPQLKDRKEDKLARLSPEQKLVYTDLATKLHELGAKDKDLADAIQMVSELRDNDTNEVKKAGVKSLDDLNYGRVGRAPRSQAEFALNNILQIKDSEHLNIALEGWRAS